ncbi:MAG: hypothetical protein AAFV80_06250, partial [Bacteroidota bacterium]
MTNKKGKGAKKKNKSPRKGAKDPTTISKDQWMWIAAALVIGFIALFPTLQGEFINYDDDIYITENPYIVNFSGEQVSALFSNYYKNQYSPVAMTIMGIEYSLFSKSGPFPFKLISVLLHLLNAFLVFKLIRELFKPFMYALITMALFAVHPMMVESIAWTTASMKVGVFTTFFLGASWTYLRYLRTEKRSMLIWTFGFFLLSCFSKEQGLALSVVLLLYDYVKGRDLKSSAVWLEKLPFLIVSMIFGVVTLRASSEMQIASQVLEYGIVDRVLFASYAIVAYWFKTLIPLSLTAFYTYPAGAIPTLYYLTPLVVIGLFVALVWAFRKDHKVVVFALVFFFMNLGLTLLSQIMATR